MDRHLDFLRYDDHPSLHSRKTAGTCVLNIVGMGVVVFLGLLFFNMVSMLTEYTVTVYREIVFRL